jgi:hypothetical protein
MARAMPLGISMLQSDQLIPLRAHQYELEVEARQFKKLRNGSSKPTPQQAEEG